MNDFLEIWEFDRVAKKYFWPTDTYKRIARSILCQNCGINPNNPGFTELFDNCVRAILRVPLDKIEKVTLRQLLNDYDLPPIYILADDVKKVH